MAGATRPRITQTRTIFTVEITCGEAPEVYEAEVHFVDGKFFYASHGIDTSTRNGLRAVSELEKYASYLEANFESKGS